MDMITVLNTIPATMPALGVQKVILLFICVVVLASIFISIYFKDASPLMFLVMLVFFVPWYFIAGSSQPEKYECTINDGVTFADFSATFEVDEQRGEIYVVHLKEKE